MKNNKKMILKTKEEKRRLAFEKRNVKKEQNLARYGAEGGSALVMAKTTDFNRRFLAALLALVFAISCLVVGVNIASQAEETNTKDILVHDTSLMDDDGFVMQTVQNNTNGMYLAKGVRANGNGSYDLKLETYATGNVEKVPTDFILVVDQSGSMARKDIPDGTPTSVSYTNIDQTVYDESKDEYEPAYYFKDDNGDYHRVYRKRGYMYHLYPGGDSLYSGDLIPEGAAHLFVNEDITQSGSSAYYIRQNNQYCQMYVNIVAGNLLYNVNLSFIDPVTGEKKPITRPSQPWYKPWGNIGETIKPGDGLISRTYYAAVNEVVTGFATDGSYTYGEFNIPLIFTTIHADTGMYMDFDIYKRYVGYNELCYTDANGEEHILMQTESCDYNGNRVTPTNVQYDNGYSGTLWKFDGSISRLEALQNSIDSFVTEVASQTNTKADGSIVPVDHRIAIVGFSGDGTNDNNEILTNTALAKPDHADPSQGINAYSSYNYSHYGKSSASGTGSNGYWSFPDGVNYIGTSNDYANSLLRTSDATQLTQIRDAASAVTAYGGTQPEYGFQKANNIIQTRNTNSQDTYTKLDGKTIGQRNTVVIYFTDGRPGDYSYSNQFKEANDVVAEAKVTKDLGAAVYSIGVFGESDANPLTYPRYKIKNHYENLYPSYTYDSDYDNLLEVYSYDADYDSAPLYASYSNTEMRDVLYRIWKKNTLGFTENASDTIRDYMSVVSSEYTASKRFVDPDWYNPDQTQRGNTTYTAMIDNERGQKGEEKYYYLATNQDSLTQAFKDIFQSESSSFSNYNSTNSYFQDTISTGFNTEQASVSFKTMEVESWDTNTGLPVSWKQSSSSPDGATTSWQQGDRDVIVNGFDYTLYHVSQDNVENTNNLSRKLVVVISNITTNETGSNLPTNIESSSGIFYKEGDSAFSNENPFPVPTVTRYKFTTRLFGDNESPQMSTNIVLKDGNGNPVSSLPETLKFYEASAQGYPEITTLNTTGYSWVPANYVKGTVYTLVVESISEDYKLQAETSNNDPSGVYTYYWGDGTTEDQAVTEFNSVFAKRLPLEDHDLVITSKTNFRPATITMKTQGVQGDPLPADYSDKTKLFPLNLTITKGTSNYSEDISATLNKDNVNEEITLIPSNGVYSSYIDSDGKTHELALADGERIDFNAPSEYVLTVSETEHDGYSVSVNNNEADTGSVTITSPTSNGLDIVNTLSANPVITGISKDNNAGSTIMWLLVALAVTTAGAGAAYVYRKKDEFVAR